MTLTTADRKFDANKLFVNNEMNSMTAVAVYIRPDSMMTRMTNRTRWVDRVSTFCMLTIL